MQTMPEDRIPVIAGVGEVRDRISAERAADGREPLVLMADAIRAAAADAGTLAAESIDGLYIVSEVSWPYDDAPGLLAQRLALRPGYRHYGEIGGESPVRFIHEAALRVASGESVTVAVVGAESQYTVNAAQKAGIALPWTPRSQAPVRGRSRDFVHPAGRAYGIDVPITVYPLFDNAAAAAWGQTPGEARRESAKLWSHYSAVAAGNEHAWSRQAYSADELLASGPDNRLIAWPYTKRMVANPAVNLGAAVIVTSLAHARRLGIADDRLVRIAGGAAANENYDYLARDRFDRSAAQEAVLNAALRLRAGEGEGEGAFDFTELYSCFPVVPKMARRVLGMAEDRPLTVTGGLSFFGAPLNNYMTHAACAMVRALRASVASSASSAREPATGLLYGQGGVATKHHALMLAQGPHDAGSGAALTPDYSVQADADSRAQSAPPMRDQYAGPATVETCTVIFDRRGEPEQGVVIARTPDGARVVARVPAGEREAIAALLATDRTPVGRAGETRAGDDGLLNWRFTG